MPLSRRGGTPSNTMWHGPRSTSVPRGVFIHPAIWPQYTWSKNWAGVSMPSLQEVAGSPSSTMWPGLRPTSMPSATLIHPAVWPNRHWPKIAEGLRPLLGEGTWVPIKHNMARDEAYLHAKFHLDLSNRLATIHQR